MECGCSLNSHVAFVNTGHRLVDKGSCLVVVVAVQLGSAPTLGEESRDTSADNRVVEFICQVCGNNFLARCVEIFQILCVVVCIDGRNDAVVYTLRNICIACERSACLCQCVYFQVVTTVNLVCRAQFEGRVEEMVSIACIVGSCLESACAFCIFNACIRSISVVSPCLCTGSLFCNFCQIPCTSIEHVRSTLHRTVVQCKCVVQVNLIEIPFVLEPYLEIAHVDAVVISESFAVSLNDIVVVGSDFVFADIGNIFLRETAIRCQFFDIAVGKCVNINPLIAAKQVVNRLIVDSLCKFSFCAKCHFKVFKLRVDIVKRSSSLLNIVMTALNQITC